MNNALYISNVLRRLNTVRIEEDMKLRALLIALICGLSSQSFAKDGLSIGCVISLRKMYQRSFDNKPRIPPMKWNGEGNAAEATYDHYTKHRLAEYGPEATALKRFGEAQQIFESGLGEEINGTVKYPDKYNPNLRVVVFLPERYRGTPLEYLIRIHENEHLLSGWDDHGTLDSATDLKSPSMGKLLDYLRGKVAVERATIRTEWEYIRLLPEEARAAMLRQMQNDPQLSPHIKELYDHAFNHYSESFDTYYKTQARLRTYDSLNRTNHIRRLLTDPLSEERMYNSYKDLPEERKNSLWKRVANDTVLDKEDREVILRVLRRYDQFAHFQPTTAIRIAKNGEDVQHENSERLHLWFRKRLPLPKNLVHRDQWSLLFRPQSSNGKVEITAVPEGYPPEMLILGVTDIAVKDPKIENIVFPKTLISNDFDKLLKEAMPKLGYKRSENEASVTYTFDLKNLPAWNQRYYGEARLDPAFPMRLQP